MPSAIDSRRLSTAATYAARSIDEDHAPMAGPFQGAGGSGAARTSLKRAQVTAPSKVTRTAHQPPESRAATSSVTSRRPVASRPPRWAKGSRTDVRLASSTDPAERALALERVTTVGYGGCSHTGKRL